MFTNALSKTYVAPVSVKNNVSESEWFDRQLAKALFFVCANSGMRSGELRKLKWEDVAIEVVGGGNTQEQRLAQVVIPALNSKVRKFRKFYCVGGIYLERARWFQSIELGTSLAEMERRNYITHSSISISEGNGIIKD